MKQEQIDCCENESKFKVEEEDFNYQEANETSLTDDITKFDPDNETAESSSESDSGSRPVAKKKKRVTKNHECPTCSKLFEKPSKLARHVQTHDVNKKPYACEFPKCFQRFATDASLKRHGILHSGMTIKVQEEKIHACIVCNKQFQVQEALASHMRSHKDVLEKLEFPW